MISDVDNEPGLIVLKLALIALALLAVISVCVLPFIHRSDRGTDLPRPHSAAYYRLIREGNLYELKRATLVAVIFIVVISVAVLVNVWVGVSLGAGLASTLAKMLRKRLLRGFATPSALILFLRPFGPRQGFDVLPALLKAASPFGRVLALARSDDRAIDNSFLVMPNASDPQEADRLAFRIKEKDINLKYGTLLRVTDSDWKRVISGWMEQASLVVVDAGQIGEGLSWEISILCKHFGPDEVIFCVPSPPDVVKALEEYESAYGRLIRLLGNWHPTLRRVVQYPSSPATNEATGKILVQLVECLTSQDHVLSKRGFGLRSARNISS